MNGSAPSICMLPSTGQDSGKAYNSLQESGQLFYGDCGSLSVRAEKVTWDTFVSDTFWEEC